MLTNLLGTWETFVSASEDFERVEDCKEEYRIQLL